MVPFIENKPWFTPGVSSRCAIYTVARPIRDIRVPISRPSSPDSPHDPALTLSQFYLDSRKPTDIDHSGRDTPQRGRSRRTHRRRLSGSIGLTSQPVTPWRCWGSNSPGCRQDRTRTGRKRCMGRSRTAATSPSPSRLGISRSVRRRSQGASRQDAERGFAVGDRDDLDVHVAELFGHPPPHRGAVIRMNDRLAHLSGSVVRQSVCPRGSEPGPSRPRRISTASTRRIGLVSPASANHGPRTEDNGQPTQPSTDRSHSDKPDRSAISAQTRGAFTTCTT